MDAQKVEFVRYTASEGKSLQWKQKVWLFEEHREIVVTMFAEKTVVLESYMLVGEVEEVAFETYADWYERNKHQLGFPHCFCS